jgi:RimJ/RimL family protein N-acetyltransferase
MLDFGTAEVGFDETDEGLTVTIDTERLRLTSVKQEDDKQYHATLFGDVDVMKKFGTGDTRNPEQVTERVKGWADRWKKKIPFSSLAVRKQTDDNVIGQVVLGFGDAPGESELAYLFGREHWGQGFGTEAVLPVVKQYAPALASKKYEIDGQPFSTITATSRVDNPASIKILEKAGMTVEKQEEKFGHMRNHYRKTLTP